MKKQLNKAILLLIGIQFPTLLPFATPLQLVVAFGVILNLFFAKILNKKYIFILILMANLFVIQYLANSIINQQFRPNWFFQKIGVMLLCAFAFIIFERIEFSNKNRTYLNYGIILSCTYAFISAPAYILGYENYLMPGNCEQNNLMLITGHLRCGAFGEGNYFGVFLSLLALIFRKVFKIFTLVAISSIVAFSPSNLAVILFLIMRNTLPNILFKFIGVICVVFCTSISFYYYYDIIELYKSIPIQSSLGERIEFILVGISIFADNLIIGVGAGQFGNYIGIYTGADHLVAGVTIEDARFIANNVSIELLSEFGLIGFISYIFFSWNLSKRLLMINNLKPIENFMLINLIGMTQPTFFIVSNFILYGLVFNKNINLILEKSK